MEQGLQDGTALEYLLLLNHKTTISVCKELEITPQQFNDWVKHRRPIPEKRLEKLEGYFRVPAELLVDERKFAKQFSVLGGIQMEIIVVINQLGTCAPEHKLELFRRVEKLEKEQQARLRMERLAKLLLKSNPKLMALIDEKLDELERIGDLYE